MPSLKSNSVLTFKNKSLWRKSLCVLKTPKNMCGLARIRWEVLVWEDLVCAPRIFYFAGVICSNSANFAKMLQIEPHWWSDRQQVEHRKWSPRYELFSTPQPASLGSEYCFLVLSWLYPISFPWFLWIEGYQKEIKLVKEWTKDRRRPSEEKSAAANAWSSILGWELGRAEVTVAKTAGSVFMRLGEVSQIWTSLRNPYIALSLFALKKFF